MPERVRLERKKGWRSPRGRWWWPAVALGEPLPHRGRREPGRMRGPVRAALLNGRLRSAPTTCVGNWLAATWPAGARPTDRVMATFCWRWPMGPALGTGNDETMDKVNLADVSAELYGLEPECVHGGQKRPVERSRRRRRPGVGRRHQEAGQTDGRRLAGQPAGPVESLRHRRTGRPGARTETGPERRSDGPRCAGWSSNDGR